MLYYNKTDLSKEIDIVISNNNKEYTVYHYWYFKHLSILSILRFKFQKSFCNHCHYLLMLSLNISDITIITVKGIDYNCIISDNSKSDTILLLESLNLCLMIKGLYEMHFKKINIKNKVCNRYGNLAKKS